MGEVFQLIRDSYGLAPAVLVASAGVAMAVLFNLLRRRKTPARKTLPDELISPIDTLSGPAYAVAIALNVQIRRVAVY